MDRPHVPATSRGFCASPRVLRFRAGAPTRCRRASIAGFATWRSSAAASTGNADAGAGGHRQIARKAANRVALRTAGRRRDGRPGSLRPRRLQARDPRHVAFEHQDRVGIVEIGARRHNRDGRDGRPPGDRWRGRCCTTGIAKRSAKIGERGDRRRFAPGAGGDDQRVFRRGENARRLVDRTVVGAGRRGRNAPRRHVIGKAGQRLGQHLARQRQVDRAFRLAGRRRRARGRPRFRAAAPFLQLVIPFDQLAHHPGLVEHLLRPVDVDVARARQRPPRSTASGRR